MSKLIGPRIFLILSLLTLPQAESARAQNQDENTIRIMTYNIHHGQGVDGRIDLDRIATIIRENRCDLVALQEVDRGVARSQRVDQAQELATKTKMEFCFGKAIDFDGGEYGLAILSSLPILESKTFSLPSSSKREQRIALEAFIKPMSGPNFVFVCTHLDHSGGENDRAEQVIEIKRLFGSGPSQAILAGDFNASLDQPEMKPLSEIWFDVDHANQAPTIPSEKPIKKIDFLFVQKDCPWSIESATVLNEPIASDHLPLVTTLRWKDEVK